MREADSSWLRGRPADALAAPPLVLRRFRPAHAAALTRAVNDSLEHLRPWMAWARTPVTTEQEQTRLGDAEARFDAGSEFAFLVFSPNEEVVGACGLHARRGPGALEIGYWVHVSHTGKGYATGAAGRLVQEAFSLPEVQRLEIRCDETNVASAAVPPRLGFRLARVEDRKPRTPAETQREMVWLLHRQQFERTSSTRPDTRPELA
ncbi:MAG TPA: GNAT family N-acetyltransferase [Acidimicrobiales bacterium]|nr:GNAT family N-acetyltransferase [Acidimicrobiales bacterium]